jgi:hypothetical protein
MRNLNDMWEDLRYMVNQKMKVVLQIGNILAVLFTIIVNALAVILPLNGKSTQELSDAIPNLFVPAGITFSIWSVIYILLICFAFYQARDLFKKEKINTPFIDQISFFFILASLANILWIFLWHYEQVVLSLFAMLLLLVSLLAIYLRLHVGKTQTTRYEKLFIHVPISVYLGWITVATIANVTAVLVKIGWDGLGISPVIWTILVMLVALIITLLMIYTRKDIAYCLVIIWALLGIALKRWSDYPEIAYTALGCLLIVAVGILFVLGMGKLKKKPVT